SVPEFHGLVLDVPAMNLVQTADREAVLNEIVLNQFSFEETLPPVVAPEIVDILLPAQVEEFPETAAELEELSGEQLEEVLLDELVIAGEKPFWTRTKVVIGSVVLLTALFS